MWKGATEEGARWGTLKNLHWGVLGFKEPALLICVTLPAYLVGAGAQKPENIRRWDRERPPDAKKETGQDPRQRTRHVWKNSEGHGAGSGRARREGCEEGHSSQRTHKVAFLHRMIQRQNGIRLGREPEGSCKVLFPEGRGRHCWKSDETGRFVRPPRGRPG